MSNEVYSILAVKYQSNHAVFRAVMSPVEHLLSRRNSPFQSPVLLSESDASRFPRVGAVSTTGPSEKTGEELPHCACFS
jgi:hypothetical protein